MNLKIIASIVLALLFSIIPLPESIAAFRPLFLTLVCMYWAIYHGQYFGLGKAWIAGIVLDVLHGTIIGQTALCLVLAVACCLLYQRRLQLSSIIQQVFILFMILLVYQFLFLWVDSINDRPLVIGERIVSAVISSLFWPAIVVLMRRLFFRGKKVTQL